MGSIGGCKGGDRKTTVMGFFIISEMTIHWAVHIYVSLMTLGLILPLPANKFDKSKIYNYCEHFAALAMPRT
jgi:hypothetical protein